MTEFLSKFDAQQLIGLVAVAGSLLCGLVCGTTAIVMDYWYKIRQLALKENMLARGLSVERTRP
jgi:hypothetical protein